MALVVDTDVVSFIFKRDTRAALYAPHLSGHIHDHLVSSPRGVGTMDTGSHVGHAPKASA